jgi:hypothetical protein
MNNTWSALHVGFPADGDFIHFGVTGWDTIPHAAEIFSDALADGSIPVGPEDR